MQSCWSRQSLHNAIVKQLLFYQSAILLLVAGGFGGFLGENAGISAFLGGLAWILPSFYFTRRVFIAMRSEKPRYMLKEFYVAEFYKLFFSAVLMILALKLFSVVAIPFISGYIILLFSCWIISVFVIVRKRL
ncbi:MAG: ATP synthase subunit I [Gammaproteobacteria bacterium]|jgi:ATP synthase protein I